MELEGTRPRRASEVLARFDRQFWVAVVLFFGVGDLVTTGYGLQSGQLVESGPLAAPVIDAFGMAGMVVLKVVVVVLFFVLWRSIPEPENVGIPLGLAVMGLLVTGWNCWVLFLTV